MQGAEAGDGAHDGETRVGGDSNTLGKGAVVGADGAAVIVAVRDGDSLRKAGAESGVGAERGQPEEGHQEVECQNSPDVVCLAARRHLLRDKQVGDDKPSEQALQAECQESFSTRLERDHIMRGAYANQGEAVGTHRIPVDQVSGHDKDHKAEKDLDTAHHHHPRGGMLDVLLRLILHSYCWHSILLLRDTGVGHC